MLTLALLLISLDRDDPVSLGKATWLTSRALHEADQESTDTLDRLLQEPAPALLTTSTTAMPITLNTHNGVSKRMMVNCLSISSNASGVNRQ